MAIIQASSVNAANSAGQAAWPGANVYVISKVVDFAVVAGDLTIGTSDVVEVLPIPADTMVLAAGFEVINNESTNTTGTLALGDGDSTARYVAAVAPVSGTLSEGAHATIKDIAPYIYATADTLDLLLATDDQTDSVIRVYAVCVNMNGNGVWKTTDSDTYSL